MDSPAVQFRPHGIYGRQISLLQIAVVLQIFVYLAVAVKSYSRKLRKLDLGFDDLLLAAAVVSNLNFLSLPFKSYFPI